MSSNESASRQLVVRIFTSDSYFFLLWVLSTTATACLLLLAAELTAETIELPTLVSVSAVLCLGVSIGLGYGLLTVTGLYDRLSRERGREGSLAAALTRIGTRLAVLLAGVVWAGIVVLGESMLAGLCTGVLFGGVLLGSERIVDRMAATRPMKPTERDACGVAVGPDRRYRTIGGAAGEQVNGKSTGILPSRETIYLTEQAFETLDNRHLEALMTHELGHLRERHPAVVVIGSGVTALLALWSIRMLLQNQWPLAIVGIGCTLTAAIALNTLQRRFEFRADRFAAEQLGDAGRMIDTLQRIQAGHSDPSQTETSSVQSLLPEQLQTSTRGLFATHPRTEQRIERLRSLGRERSSESR